MRFKARSMNAYLRASHLAHIPAQIAWKGDIQGVLATPVNCAYSSQECSVCHYTDRRNRPDQQTFCCQVCGFQTHADINGAVNVSQRKGDRALHACKDRKAIKALLMKRHEAWLEEHGKGTHQTKGKRRGKGAKVHSQSVTARKTRTSKHGSLSSLVIPQPSV